LISVTKLAWNCGIWLWTIQRRGRSSSLWLHFLQTLGTSLHVSHCELAPADPSCFSFHDLAWTHTGDSYERGVIAGALDSGTLGLWNVDRLLEDKDQALVASTKNHSGAIKALQFNPRHSNLLATGGAKGELFITDLNNAAAPIRLGSTAARADDIDCLDWNKKVSHIMVTGSSGGFVTVWDMKTKKESLTLNNYGRKAVSAVAWDPEKPTRLITAVPLEQEPVILVWDLRNSNAPEKTMRGHDSGVLSLSWCQQDSDLLLSCGKDNRTICWNPQTGQPYGDFPVVTNWTFQTRWNPHNPNLFATASFDGKLSVQSIQNTNPSATQASDQNLAADGEEFFSKAQTASQTSSFSLPKAPRWLERPISASFGFGGRIVTARPAEPGKSRTSKIEITKFEVDSSVGSATNEFESTLQSGDLAGLCASRIANANSEEEKVDWIVIEALVSNKPRKKIVDYLGFSESDEAADGLAELDLGADKKDSQKPQINGTAGRSHKRFSSMFDSTPDGDFLSELAATQVTRTNNPFQIYTGSESEADRRITRALLLGQFDKALDVCLQEDRMSDAFMVAICGGNACIQKAQEAYFAKQSGGPNYLRLLASVVGKNLWDVVHNADLANWKEVMATLCTFADEKEFPDLCDALGDRLEEQMQQQRETRKDASFCYLAGSKLEKVVSIWLQELKESESAEGEHEENGSAFSIHARGLQNFVEKVTVFRKATHFQDSELSQTSDWKLEPLYQKYLEYADILAAHGQLSIAERYLDLLPRNYPEADVARSRIKQATKKSSPAVVTTQAATTSRQKPLPAVGGYQPQSTPFSPATPQAQTPHAAPAPAQAGNPYAPPSSSHPSNPYAPPNPYASVGGYQPPQQMRGPVAPPPQSYGTPQPSAIPPPPRAYNQSPSIPPPSKATNMSNWNDIPEGFTKPPTSRRGTPSVPPQPIASPFAGQPPVASQGPPPPMAPQYSRPQRETPPPPKGPAPPPRVTSPLAAGQQQQYESERPSSRSANAYAPQPAATPPIGQNLMQPPIPRGPSPYNAPPSNAPPPNRYTPAPGSQSSAPISRPPIGPPPPASPYSSAPPPNPYAPALSQVQPAPSPYAPQTTSQPFSPQTQPPQQSQPPPQAAPPQQTSRPSTAQSDRRAPARKYRKFPSDF
jgi:protein transport protein SEC31